MTEPNSPTVTDEMAPAPAPDQPTAAPQRRSRSAAIALMIALLALLLAVGLGVATYFIWYQVQQQGDEQAGIETGLSDRLQPLRTSTDALGKQLQQKASALEHRIDGFDQEQRALAQRLSVLSAVIGRSETGWSLAEVEYLLRVANQRLQLQHDPRTALQALRAADERLRDLTDPHYQGVREQIANDINAINAVPAVDVDGLAATLSAAIKQVEQLPLVGSHYRPASKSDGETGDSVKPAGRIAELGKVVWASLSKLFRLREHDQPVRPMLAPEREYFLRENLQLQLAAARLALLREDRAQYRLALQTAQDWLKQYFDPQAPGVQQQIDRLQEIAAVDISPSLPDVSASLRLLRQQMQLSAQAPVLPVVPDEPAQDSQDSQDSQEPSGNKAGDGEPAL